MRVVRAKKTIFCESDERDKFVFFFYFFLLEKQSLGSKTFFFFFRTMMGTPSIFRSDSFQLQFFHFICMVFN